MLCMALNPGEAVQIGEDPDAGAVIKIERKTGRKVNLRIATNLRIEKLVPGIVPQRFVFGITGKPTERYAAAC